MLYRIKGKIKEKICSKTVFHKSFFSLAFGLMFRKRIKDEAHVFLYYRKTRIAITMSFMRFPIDLVYLDESNKVIEMKENLKPWQNYYPKKESEVFLELPGNTIKKFNLKTGDKLEF